MTLLLRNRVALLLGNLLTLLTNCSLTVVPVAGLVAWYGLTHINKDCVAPLSINGCTLLGADGVALLHPKRVTLRRKPLKKGRKICYFLALFFAPLKHFRQFFHNFIYLNVFSKL